MIPCCLKGICTNGQCGFEDNCPASQVECNTNQCDGAGTCVSTLQPETCDDGNLCTNDLCTSAGCVYTKKGCDDGISCTDDTCDKTSGCIFTPNNFTCNDNNECTDDICDISKGCNNTEIVCNSSGVCSNSTCDPLYGCMEVPIPCSSQSDASTCTVVVCDENYISAEGDGCKATTNTCYSSIAVAIGSSVGAATIVGIVLAIALVGVGGGGAAAVYQQTNNNADASIQTSPLYVSPVKGGANPLFEPPSTP